MVSTSASEADSIGSNPISLGSLLSFRAKRSEVEKSLTTSCHNNERMLRIYNHKQVAHSVLYMSYQ